MITGDIRELVGGGYGVIYADPAWVDVTYSDKGLEGRPQHYARMATEDIAAMPVRDIAARDCHLFLWTTWRHLPQAFQVAEAWGFRYSSSAFLWVKLAKRFRGQTPSFVYDLSADMFLGMGKTTRKNTEPCLLFRRGSPKRLRSDIPELLIAPVREHSRKPDEAYERIEAYAPGPRCELFARTARPGWSAWGNEVGKFPALVGSAAE